MTFSVRRSIVGNKNSDHGVPFIVRFLEPQPDARAAPATRAAHANCPSTGARHIASGVASWREYEWRQRAVD